MHQLDWHCYHEPYLGSLLKQMEYFAILHKCFEQY